MAHSLARLLAGGALALALLGPTASAARAQDAIGLPIGTQAPAASVQDLEGKPVDLLTLIPKGKPALERGDRSEEQFHFNLAHSGDYALYGFARSELGVDIEVMREDRDLLGLARRFFAPLERATIQALPDAGRRAAFYHVWTRKEADIKARGTGLSERLDGFDVTARPGEPARVLRVSTGDEIADDWSLFDVQPLPDVTGAVALRGHGWKVRGWRLEI